MLKGFTYKDPDNNGIDDTIGLTDRNDLIYGAFKTISSYYGTPNNWGWYNDSLRPEFVFPKYMETMKFFKKLHNEGLINEDFPITSKTDQLELFVTGKAGVYIGAMGMSCPWSQSCWRMILMLCWTFTIGFSGRKGMVYGLRRGTER